MTARASSRAGRDEIDQHEHMSTMSDEELMRHALALATHARDAGEVPVGAVVSRAGNIIGEGWNQPISSHDPTAHAEIIALRRASAATQNYRLPGTTLHVTLEPCVMCIGAILSARVERLVFGAWDKKMGACGTLFDIPRTISPLCKLDVFGGVRSAECAALLTEFFKGRR